MRAVEITGLRALAEETVLFYLGLKVGEPLELAVLDRNVHELWDRKLIDDIRIEKESVADGIRLVITIRERPRLRSIEFKGLEGMSRKDVDERMAEAQIDLREGEPLSLGEISRLKALLESEYRERGFRFANVSFTVEEASADERRVVFTVVEAEKVRIGQIQFEGNSVFADWRLRLLMKKTKETGLVSRVLKKDGYNAAAVTEDLQRVVDYYRARGYKTAHLGEPELSVVGGRKRRLVVTVPVAEGSRWKLGDVRVEGSTVFKEDFLRARIERPWGDWLRAKVVTEGVEKIRDLYRNSGHIMSDVKSEFEEREGNISDLVIRITEGDQYRVGRIEFEGNTRTRDNVLRREFRVQEGMLMNMGAVKNSIFKINQLSYFKLDEDDPVAFRNFDSENSTVDLVVKGEEAERYQLEVGGGWSESYGLFGQVSARTVNFRGRGDTLGFSFQSGTNSSQYDLTYAVPWLFERPQSISAQIYSTDVDYSQYSSYDSSQDSEGASLTYGRSFGLFQNASLTYSIYDRLDRLTVLDVDGDPLTVEYDVLNSSLRLGYGFDSRDSRMEPTRGLGFLTSLEYAGGLLRGTNDFVRPALNASYFRSVTKAPLRSLLGVNLKTGWIVPTEGEELVPLERYYLGGENSVRGFSFRDITVRCVGGEPYPGRTRSACRPNERLVDDSFALLGGDKFLQVNLEYHILISGPFRLIGFLDAGNVFSESQSIDFARLRRTAGLELRVFVPVFGAPLRFIYAENLAPFDDDVFETFQFSIGSTF